LASVAAMKFRHKPLRYLFRCFIALVAKSRAGSIINLKIFKKNVMEQITMIQPEWSKVAEVELVYKTKVKASERPLIKISKDCYQTFLKVWDENKLEMQEEFKVLLINRANRVTGVYEASAGGITGTVADPRLILAAAIKGLAVGIVLAHNHPSGNLKPSLADEQLTAKIKTAASYHDIRVLDHIIVTADAYYSFADEGLL
jgi:DNA repair protein RadC